MKSKKLISLLALLGITVSAGVAGVTLSACGGDDGPGPEQGVWYVSPEGKKEAKGTQNDPLQINYVLQDADLKPGDTVMVLPGRYDLSQRIVMLKSGAYNNYITVKNADPTQKATLAFYDLPFASVQRGVQIYSNYIHWDSIDVCGAGDNGLYIGGSYNIVENSCFYDNRDTGLQLGRSYSELYEEEDTDHVNNIMANINYWPSHNLIKNCTSYNNYDNETYGENADGFAAKLTVGYGNVFDGCIAYRNSDDGWDLFAKTDSGNIGMVIMYNCVAFENGYLMETQESFNAKCNFDQRFAEANTNSFKTNNGDGNGFKLGGSVMEGEVLIYNCLSFHNGQHGVTDNSNPGVITINGVTSYNNSAGVDNNPSSPTFGQIKYVGGLADDPSANIDLARQTYSYNNVANVLSVNNGNAYQGNDRYRGSVENSVLVASASEKYTVNNVEELNTHVEGLKGDKSAAAAATDIFKQLADVNFGLTYKDTVHKVFRNEDNSINFGEFFAVKDETAYTQGSRLNKTSWDQYTHYDFTDLTTATSENEAVAMAIRDLMYVPVNTAAVCQDFDVVTKILNKNIVWTSSDPNVLNITDQTGTSYSKHEDVRIQVNRPIDADKQVTLTARVNVGGVEKSKDFVLTVRKNTFRATATDFVVPGVVDNEVIVESGTFNLPDFTVKNDTSDSGVAIDSSHYDTKRTYRFRESAKVDFATKLRYNNRTCGIWEITETITFHDDVALAKLAEKTVSYVYQIYIVSPTADIEQVEGTGSFSVNMNGYSLGMQPSDAAGILYTYTQASGAAAPTADTIKASGVKTEFRATKFTFDFEQDNSASYDLYYVLANMNDEITSDIYKIEVKTKDITTKAQLEQMLAFNNAQEIYILKNDIDCEGTFNVSAAGFKAVFNGMGHTVKNISLDNNVAGESRGFGLFPVVSGGTIMNVNFENISIKDNYTGHDMTGLIGKMEYGYVSNVKIKNYNLIGKQRVGGLVGEIHSPNAEGWLTYIERVSITNSLTKNGEGKYDNSISGELRVGGIVGHVQQNSSGVTNFVIKNCMVNSRIDVAQQYGGGIVGRSDDRFKNDRARIENCIFTGELSCPKYTGGIIGGFSGAGIETIIRNCIYLGTMYFTNDLTLVTECAKNCSGIMGYYAANANISVTRCFSTITEHNPNYNVTWFDEPVEEDEEGIPKPYSKDFWLTYSGFDLEGDNSIWKFVHSTVETVLPSPYIELR